MTYEDLRPMEKEIIEALWDAKKNDPPSYIAMLGLVASKNNTDFIKKMVLPYYSRGAMKRAIKCLRKYQARNKDEHSAAERAISFIRRELLGRQPDEIKRAAVEGTALI